MSIGFSTTHSGFFKIKIRRIGLKYFIVFTMNFKNISNQPNHELVRKILDQLVQFV